MNTGRRVRIIVDAAFGEQLAMLPQGEAVWIVQSPHNTQVVQRLWREREQKSCLSGITSFNAAVPDTPEENLISILETVAEHHPKSSEFEVIGCKLTGRISKVLDEIKYHVVAETADGFIFSDGGECQRH